MALREDRRPYRLRQCCGCGCVFTDVGDLGSGVDYYTDDYYSFQPYSAEQVRAWERSSVKAEMPRKILDVGCGSGEWLCRKKAEGHQVWGLEQDERAVKVARANGLEVVRDFKDLPDAHFDFIRLSHVLEHTPAPAEMMTQVKRKLGPGGQVELLVPNLESAKFAELMHVSGLTDMPRHLCFFSEATMRRLLEKTGLRPEVITQLNVPWPINLRETAGDLRRLAMYASKARPPLSQVFSLLGRVLWIHLVPSARTGARRDWLFARAHHA